MILPYLHARTGLSDIAPETHLRELPRLDDIDVLTLANMIEQETMQDVPDSEIEKWSSVSDVLASMERRQIETQPKAA